ncbi:hypothetical protein Xbed_02888 [Xenorhabdus beddingii]|uniref:Uncharacterized protein n=1 Tax=Xenorhabdus beddingii TaxID=40578 RepID=A0A1Y2SJ38_9GAMM|nr:hypothetical protein [Xenorhabdus beddingii]OTA18902.1 hypothetical protein Xbed_02888 [Xenorhabdus beddingii]
MLIEDILRKTLRLTQYVFAGGAGNKFFYRSELMPATESCRNVDLSIRLKHLHLQQLRTEMEETTKMSQQYDYLIRNRPASGFVGNCGEYSYFAFYHLMKMCPADIRKTYTTNKECPIYVQLPVLLQPYDHTFILIYQADSLSYHPNRFLKFNAIPSDAWVCDPWADIICLAQHYDDVWKNQMAKWHQKGLCIRTVLSDEKLAHNQNYSPLRERTYTNISNGNKFIAHLGTIYPNGKNTVHYWEF